MLTDDGSFLHLDSRLEEDGSVTLLWSTGSAERAAALFRQLAAIRLPTFLFPGHIVAVSVDIDAILAERGR